MNKELTVAVILALAALGYFLPTCVSLIRGKAQSGVFILNLVLGWTVVGWFVALIWACSGCTIWSKRRERQRHRNDIARVTPWRASGDANQS